VKIISLLAQNFLLRLALVWVEIRIQLIRFSGIAGMIALFAIFCSGCAHAPKPSTSYAPSPAGVLKAVTESKAHATALRSEVTTPAGLRTLADLHTSLDTSLSEVAAYSAKVDAVSLALSKAEESSKYWEAKQQKALKELWIWRIIIMGEVGAALGYLAFRLGWKFAF
jgi:hypothetical protein